MPDEMVDSAVDAILQTAASGKIGDCKIFISKIEEVIRIRNLESGLAAL